MNKFTYLNKRTIKARDDSVFIQPLNNDKINFQLSTTEQESYIRKKKKQRQKKKNTRAQIMSKVFRHTLFSGENYNQQKSIFDTELLMRCGIA